MKLRFLPGMAESDAEAEDKPFWQHRRWQLSAAFIAVVVFGGMAALIGGAGGADASDAPSAGPVIGGLGPDGARPQGCRTDDADQRLPAAPPRDIVWQPLNGAETPISASAGPLKSTGPLLWCFAHTPMGAVMAAHVIPRHMSGPEWRAVTHQQLVPGFERDYFEAMRASMKEDGTVRSASTLTGFQVVKYSPATATIRLLLQQVDATYASLDYTVDWDGVDWKLRPLTMGALYTNVAPVYSVAGFVLWSGA